MGKFNEVALVRALSLTPFAPPRASSTSSDCLKVRQEEKRTSEDTNPIKSLNSSRHRERNAPSPLITAPPPLLLVPLFPGSIQASWRRPDTPEAGVLGATTLRRMATLGHLRTVTVGRRRVDLAPPPPPNLRKSNPISDGAKMMERGSNLRPHAAVVAGMAAAARGTRCTL